MRLLADENVRSAHVSALESAGHDVLRVEDLLEKGAPDTRVRAAGNAEDRVILTYDRKDFAGTTDHAGVLVADERMPPRAVRRAVDRIEGSYPDLDGVVDFLSDWA